MSRFTRFSTTKTNALHGSVNYFFDRANVKAQLTAKERAAMSKIGAYMRRTMRSIMRPSTKPNPHSMPGQPPRHSAGLIRKSIDFHYSPWRHSVIVGPGLISTNSEVKPIGKTIPQLLDEGGLASSGEHYVLRDRETGRIMSLASRGAQLIMRGNAYKKSKGKKTARYHLMKMKAGPKRFKARPFRQPTMDANLNKPQLQAAWSVIN